MWRNQQKILTLFSIRSGEKIPNTKYKCEITSDGFSFLVTGITIKDSYTNIYYCTVFQYLEHYDLDVSGRDRTMRGNSDICWKRYPNQSWAAKGLLHPIFLPCFPKSMRKLWMGVIMNQSETVVVGSKRGQTALAKIN